MHPVLGKVTERLRERSARSRAAYLSLINAAPAPRQGLSCGNLAHGMAACSAQDKQRLALPDEVNVGIVTAYNDMLSAHQPYERYPALLRQYLRRLGRSPAVCRQCVTASPRASRAWSCRWPVVM